MGGSGNNLPVGQYSASARVLSPSSGSREGSAQSQSGSFASTRDLSSTRSTGSRGRKLSALKATERTMVVNEMNAEILQLQRELEAKMFQAFQLQQWSKMSGNVVPDIIIRLRALIEREKRRAGSLEQTKLNYMYVKRILSLEFTEDTFNLHKPTIKQILMELAEEADRIRAQAAAAAAAAAAGPEGGDGAGASGEGLQQQQQQQQLSGGGGGGGRLQPHRSSGPKPPPSGYGRMDTPPEMEEETAAPGYGGMRGLSGDRKPTLGRPMSVQVMKGGGLGGAGAKPGDSFLSQVRNSRAASQADAGSGRLRSAVTAPGGAVQSLESTAEESRGEHTSSVWSDSSGGGRGDGRGDGDGGTPRLIIHHRGTLSEVPEATGGETEGGGTDSESVYGGGGGARPDSLRRAETSGGGKLGIPGRMGRRTASVASQDPEEDFLLCLESPMRWNKFHEFLAAEGAEENLLFWHECETFRKEALAATETLGGDTEAARKAAWLDKARAIYGTYVADGDAELPVELNQSSRDALKTALEAGSVWPDSLVTVQSEIFHLMAARFFPRFRAQESPADLVAAQGQHDALAPARAASAASASDVAAEAAAAMAAAGGGGGGGIGDDDDGLDDLGGDGDVEEEGEEEYEDDGEEDLPEIPQEEVDRVMSTRLMPPGQRTSLALGMSGSSSSSSSSSGGGGGGGGGGEGGGTGGGGDERPRSLTEEDEDLLRDLDEITAEGESTVVHGEDGSVMRLLADGTQVQTNPGELRANVVCGRIVLRVAADLEKRRAFFGLLFAVSSTRW